MLIDLSPPTSVPTDILLRDVAATTADLTAMYRRLLGMFESITMFVWHHPQFSPQEVFDAFGPDAADLLKLSDAFMAFVAAYTNSAPVSPVPDGWQLTVNQDGTVSVKAPPPAPMGPEVFPEIR